MSRFGSRQADAVDHQARGARHAPAFARTRASPLSPSPRPPWTTCERLGRRLSDARCVGKQAYRRCRRPPLGGQRGRDGARIRVSQAAANCGVPYVRQIVRLGDACACRPRRLPPNPGRRVRPGRLSGSSSSAASASLLPRLWHVRLRVCAPARSMATPFRAGRCLPNIRPGRAALGVGEASLDAGRVWFRDQLCRPPGSEEQQIVTLTNRSPGNRRGLGAGFTASAKPVRRIDDPRFVRAMRHPPACAHLGHV